MRDLARRLAILILLAPLLALGLVAVYTHGTMEAGLAIAGILVSIVAVIGIFMLERPSPLRRSRRSILMESYSADDGYVNEHAVDLDLGVRWDLASPDAWFVHRDGEAALILKPEVDDEDRRLVVLVWAPCTAARFGPPNAENRQEHPLYTRGLRDCEWAAEVRQSTRVTDGDRHFVIMTRDGTIEVVAPDVIIHRIERIRLAASASDEARR